jgi:hypothetical protein
MLELSPKIVVSPVGSRGGAWSVNKSPHTSQPRVVVSSERKASELFSETIALPLGSMEGVRVDDANAHTSQPHMEVSTERKASELFSETIAIPSGSREGVGGDGGDITDSQPRLVVSSSKKQPEVGASKRARASNYFDDGALVPRHEGDDISLLDPIPVASELFPGESNRV